MIDVVAAIIEDRGQILACRRRIERQEGGMWEFPGGKVELGELAAEALVREIQEELNVEIESGDEFITVDKGNLRLIFMLARLTGPRPLQSTDHDRLEWLLPDQLKHLVWAPADQTAVEHLLADRGFEQVKPAATADREDDS